jgi:hypothetical protein
MTTETDARSVQRALGACAALARSAAVPVTVSGVRGCVSWPGTVRPGAGMVDLLVVSTGVWVVPYVRGSAGVIGLGLVEVAYPDGGLPGLATLAGAAWLGCLGDALTLALTQLPATPGQALASP